MHNWSNGNRVNKSQLIDACPLSCMVGGYVAI